MSRNMVRLTFSSPKERVEEMRRLAQRLGWKTLREYFNFCFTLGEAAVTAALVGETVGQVDLNRSTATIWQFKELEELASRAQDKPTTRSSVPKKSHLRLVKKIQKRELKSDY